MVIYNISQNFSANNIYEMAQNITRLEPNYGHALVLVFGALLFFTSVAKHGFIAASLAATFAMSIVTILFFRIGLVDGTFTLTILISTSAIAGYSWWDRSVRGTGS